MMRGIKNKESGKWKKWSIFLILLLVFIVLLNSVSKVYKKKKEVEKTLTRMQAEVVALDKRKEFLKESLEKLKTREGVEFEIRKKLNVATPGEGVAIIVDEEQSTTTSNQNISSWQKFKNFFSRIFR